MASHIFWSWLFFLFKRQLRQVVVILQFVKIALEEAVLDHTVLLKLRLGILLGKFGSNAASILQNVFTAGFEYDVNALCPIFHSHRDVAFGHTFAKFEHTIDQLRKALQFLRPSPMNEPFSIRFLSTT